MAQLQQSESALTLHVAQLDKKLNDMQRVYMKGVKSTVESIRAGRAGLGGGARWGRHQMIERMSWARFFLRMR